MKVLTRREADIFACLADTAVHPDPARGLPPVRQTNAVEAFDDWLAHAPKVNQATMRLALHMVELAPRATGAFKRLRQLPRADRERFLERLDRTALRSLADALVSVAKLTYYGDDEVSNRCGYDRQERLATAAAVRAKEHRP